MTCDYCITGEKYLTKKSDLHVYIDSNYDTIDVAFYGENGWEIESIDIEYCPKCGRKLGDNNE